ncbi:hypothetical protein OUZ56_012388 [Daphnia magna]|uniref:Retrotransposon gag domain-containing protein n=1 Tax=Daphnia magna TaxID=35525 RepID=A0ABQ9Z2V8_9CRUS|nr:hypothetical protein OUZ56_012388 [Daphnia magna]
MKAFSSAAIFCDRQKSGRFDDRAAHFEATLDLGNFEEARKLRLLRSKVFHSTETRSQLSVEFNNMKREPEENMRRYANRFRKAFYKA